MGTTERCNDVNRSKSKKFLGSWDLSLQLGRATLNGKLLVIEYQNDSVNALINSVHTARHGLVRGLLNLVAVEFCLLVRTLSISVKVTDSAGWNEVVTR